MLFEYAVDPVAIGSDWATFKDLIDRFGTEKGRVISRLPMKWEKKVIQAAKSAGIPDVRIKSIIERLRNAKHKVLDYSRVYDHNYRWVDNALREHGNRPFRAIICNDQTTDCREILLSDDCDDNHPLLSSEKSKNVQRTAVKIAEALFPLFAAAKEVDIVDPYFDLRPHKGDYIAPLKSLFYMLCSTTTTTPKLIRVHFRTHDSRPSSEIFARDAYTKAKDILPPNFSLEFNEWSEVEGGEDFHDRFLLTDIGGLMIGAGFSATGPAETAALTLLEIDHVQELRSRFSSTSVVYTKVGKTLRVVANVCPLR